MCQNFIKTLTSYKESQTYMKTIGIIAEYNPFHNGHQYQIETAKALTGADYVVAVMSGDYVQRGAPAAFSKSLRTKAALLGGADLVLEMPVFGSVAPAMDFAVCGVSLLTHTGITDFLCFGSESGDLAQLAEQAEKTEHETKEISERIREGLKAGMSWPSARARAYEDAASLSLIQTPNDILGIEYLRALKKSRSPIPPLVIKRKGSAYHDTDTPGPLASAAAARKALLEDDQETLKKILPPAAFALSIRQPVITLDDLSLLLNQKLLTADKETLLAASQMPKALADRLFKNRLHFTTASDTAARSKDRQYTYARVSRCLLNVALGITAEQTMAFKFMDSAPWLRITGFKRSAAPLLAALKKHTDLPILSKTADAKNLLSPAAFRLLKKHLETAELYRLLCETKTGHPLPNEYTRPIIIL